MNTFFESIVDFFNYIADHMCLIFSKNNHIPSQKSPYTEISYLDHEESNIPILNWAIYDDT